MFRAIAWKINSGSSNLLSTFMCVCARFAQCTVKDHTFDTSIYVTVLLRLTHTCTCMYMKLVLEAFTNGNDKTQATAEEQERKQCVSADS